MLKAWGDAQVLDGNPAEAAELYEQALDFQPDSFHIVVVSC